MTTNFQKLYGDAHNLCSAYDNLRGLRELFKQAAEAEKFLSQVADSEKNAEARIKSLSKTEQDLHARCRDEAQRIKDMKKGAELELEAFRRDKLKELKSTHQKQVEEAKDALRRLNERIAEGNEVLEAKLSRVAQLSKEIQQKEGQMEALDDQFRKIQKALVGEV